jgi:hypothetical protein
VTGLIAPEGTMMAALIVAPGLPAAALLLPEDDGLPELPQAEITAPSTGSDMPTMVPRRRKSLRDIRPAANSSMTWFAISP